jgi:integrase
MFYRAQDWGVYSGPNPVKKVRFYKEQSPVKFLKPNEVERILEAAENISKKPKSSLQKSFYDIVVFALNTGMRKSEILQLKWNDIDNGAAKVKGKGDKVRMVPLNKTAREVIGRQQKRDAYVFDIPNRNQHDLMRRTVATIRKKTGIDWHFHMLCHTFATRLIEKGVDFVTLAEILGHSKYTISLIYGHTTTDRMRDAVECLE